MADKKITELTALTAADVITTDPLVIVDLSANETKKITMAELGGAFKGAGNIATNVALGVEALKLAQTPSYLHRNAGNFYEHSQIFQGYTNENQILGSGAGFGNNIQTFSFSYNNHWNKFGIIFNHIANSPMALVSGVEDLGLRTVKWDDYSYGIQSRYRYKNILFSANMEWVNSKNYQWIDGHRAGNFYAVLNTIFLW